MEVNEMDEMKARKIIDTIDALREEAGVDTFINLDEDFVEVTIEKFGKKLASEKIDTSKISEMTNDELSYAVFSMF